jgi:hypothetical protein
MSKKMSKEDWIQRHKDLIDHKHELHVAIGKMEAKGTDDTLECDQLKHQLELTEGAIKIAEGEAAK